MIDPRSLRTGFPIHGKLVTLYVFTEKDVTDAYLGWLNDPAVVRHSDQRFYSHTRETSLAYLETCRAAGGLFITIHTKNARKYVGTMSVHFSPMHETADMGILIGDKTCWGAGVGSDAWSTLMSFLVHVAGIRNVST